ncbi:MAG TPA: hypothetical protein VMG12_32555 [Polyangiaceae bacterium]|nr:hypothetical protein [Polyangiaceae bacterium]
MAPTGLMRASSRVKQRTVWIGAVSTAAVSTAALAWTSLASARPMDPALSRLVVDARCQTDAAVACVPDRAAYTKLVSQLGAALAPHAPHAARTTGLGGFDVSLLGAITSIDSGADYWRRGTLGSAAAAAENDDPEPYLQLYTLELRKGFGFGIEAAASLGLMPHTSLLSWGADVRVALLEGMRHGLWRYLPDTSLGGSWRRATGLGELALGTLALDARFSHPFTSPLGFSVTPWLGYQWVRIDAGSELVDLTPRVGALEACDYVGNAVPGSPGSLEAEGALPASGAPAASLDGSPLCRASGADLQNTASFGDVAVHRHRVLVGASYRREPLRIGAQLETDLVRPDAAQSDSDVSRALRCDASGANCRASPRQWSVVLEVGASF